MSAWLRQKKKNSDKPRGWVIKKGGKQKGGWYLVRKCWEWPQSLFATLQRMHLEKKLVAGEETTFHVH